MRYRQTLRSVDRKTPFYVFQAVRVVSHEDWLRVSSANIMSGMLAPGAGSNQTRFICRISKTGLPISLCCGGISRTAWADLIEIKRDRDAQTISARDSFPGEDRYSALL